MLDQKWKSMEAVYRSKSRRNSTSNSQRFMEALSKRIKSCRSTIAWTISEGTFFQQCNFLYWSENEWPKTSQSEQVNEEQILQEADKNVPDVTHSLITTACDKFNPKVGQIIDIGRFSDVTKINSDNRVCDQVHQQVQEPNTWKP